MEIGISILLLFFSAFFSSSETALFLLSSKSQPDKGLILKLVKKPVLLLNTLLLGNMLVNILFSGIAESFLTEHLFDSVESLQLRIFLVIISSTFIVLVFGEVLPKNLGLNYTAAVAKMTSYPVYFLRKILFPITYPLALLTNFLIKKGENEEEFFSKSEIRSVLRYSRQRGILKRDETDLIERIVNFSHMDLETLLIARKDLQALNLKASLEEAWQLMREHNFSKLLVFKENIDNIIGFLHIRDLFEIENKENLLIEDCKDTLRKIHFVPETKNPVEVLKILRAQKVSFAVVLDEYGGTAGVLTFNSIIRSIIGEYLEETGFKTPDFFLALKNLLVVNATLSMARVKEHFKIENEWEDEEDTVASFVLKKTDKIPEVGEEFKAYGLSWKVIAMKDHSIDRVRVQRGGIK